MHEMYGASVAMASLWNHVLQKTLGVGIDSFYNIPRDVSD
jgi:hypothetical protein